MTHQPVLGPATHLMWRLHITYSITNVITTQLQLVTQHPTTPTKYIMLISNVKMSKSVMSKWS